MSDEINVGRRILGEDAPEDPAMEMKMLRVALVMSQRRTAVTRSVIAANQYGLPDKEALNLIFLVAIALTMEEMDHIDTRMQAIIDEGVEKANKRL